MNSFLIRPACSADSNQIAYVHVRCWEETYHHLMPPECLAQANLNKRQQQWADYFAQAPAEQFLWVTVDSTEQIMGFVCGGPERTHHPGFDGEVYALYVLQEWHQRGVGRLLMHQAFQLLAKQQRHHLLVWVLQQNPARRFYESLQGQLVAGRQVDLGGAWVTEVAYGWRLP